MYKIALICEHGASTGMCVVKMTEAAERLNIVCDIAAYSTYKLDNIVDKMDCILIGPQLGFKLDSYKKKYPDHSTKITVVNSMDFAAMDGEKILKDTISLIEQAEKQQIKEEM